MRSQALGANGASLVAGAASVRHGKAKAITRPVVVLTKSLRVTVLMRFSPS